MLNRVKNPKPRIRGIPRKKDHFNATGKLGVQAGELLHEGEGHARLEGLVFPGNLILSVGLNPLFFEDAITFVEVKQGARRKGDDERCFTFRVGGHGAASLGV